MENWRVELAVEGQTVAEVKIQWGIFLRHSSLQQFNDTTKL